MSPLSPIVSAITTPFLCFAPHSFLCPKQAAPVPLALTGLEGGQAVSTSGYHISQILPPQHPFPNRNETMWQDQKARASHLTTKRQLCPGPQPWAPVLCRLHGFPGFVELRGRQSAGPAGAEVKWRTRSVLCKTSATREILFHPNSMPDSWEHSLWQVQGLPAFICLLPAACSLEGHTLFSL